MGDIRGDRFVDGNDAAFFLDASDPGISLSAGGTILSAAFLDRDNDSFFLDPASAAISLKAAGDILADGNLGIGTNNPLSALHVQGTIRASNFGTIQLRTDLAANKIESDIDLSLGA